MTYKSLLTILPLEEGINTLVPAIELAKDLDAHLDIVIVGALWSPSDYFYGGISDRQWEENNLKIYKLSEALTEEVETLVAEHQISANVMAERQFKETTGTVLSRYTLCTDLNVLTYQSMQLKDQSIKAYYRELINAGRPAIILKDETFKPNELSNIIIAWNGKPEAAKAFHYALPFLQLAEKVHLVMIDPERSELGENPGHDIAAFITRHDVEVTVDPIASEGNSITDALLQRVDDVNADLLVMGAYGTTKLKEWLGGGTTQTLLSKADLPVFLCH